MSDAWAAIERAGSRSLADLFAAEADRLPRLTLEEAGIRFDFAKTHLGSELVSAFELLAEERDLAGAREALFAGAIVNPTEGRAAEHMAERGQGAPESVARALAFHGRMRAMIDAIEAGAFGEIRHILHIGIGGSALGPDFLIDALGRDTLRYDAAIVSNVDGTALEDAIADFDPQTTLIAVASKTFTTMETLLNTRSALAWLEQGGVADPYGRVIALTAAPERAIEFGVDETRILPFWDTVGGRYSLWSSIGFPPHWHWAGSSSSRSSKGRRRWTATSGSPRCIATPPSSPPSSTAITPTSAAPRPAPSSPMTSGCACFPPISSSSRWSRTARA
jgi:glucose-6-phosphate isomerase